MHMQLDLSMRAALSMRTDPLLPQTSTLPQIKGLANFAANR
jgi:hypothetical protein